MNRYVKKRFRFSNYQSYANWYKNEMPFHSSEYKYDVYVGESVSKQYTNVGSTTISENSLELFSTFEFCIC